MLIGIKKPYLSGKQQSGRFFEQQGA